MKHIATVAVALAAVLIGCAQARADVSASVSVYADAGETAGLSTSPTKIDEAAYDNGASGAASVARGWPLTPFLPDAGLDCPSTGCADRSAGATASVDEGAGILRAGAGTSLLVGNAPDANFGGVADVTSESRVDDVLTLSKPATVVLEGSVHGGSSAWNSDPLELGDPRADTSVSIGFCCRMVRGEGPAPLGGFDQDYWPDAADGTTYPAGDSFSIPIELPAGDTMFSADLKQSVSLLIDGDPLHVFAQNALADFTGTVTFKLVVPGDVVATSSSGLLPIEGGAPATAPDTTAPTTVSTVSPTPNAAGWNHGPVVVHLAASDAGSGVASIAVATSGSTSTTAGDSVDVPVSSEGTTTISYHATDEAGNVEAPQTTTVRIDETPPSVVYAGNAGEYSVDQQVAITCHATDGLSGIATSTCHDVTVPAYELALGVNTLTASATDNAGNDGNGETSFIVVAGPGSVANLTADFVRGSAAYEALSPQMQAVVSHLADNAERVVARMRPTLRPAEKAAFLRAYDAALAHLVRGGWLTGSQTATLTGLAATL
jgi:hypothetical protein